ncbi:MaoC family dehydratase N-terminal domain-containing protein [Thalassococcus sp. S3]|uniref:FAS1-like dehydratase domain-containing protein n=1 Tax=Thalassococcus sp. S3 TaxID=2017482 RepID=UPI0010245FEF|nr:MaoC family dehydratase N-terminal domain-containing protein [Thalassococcus sp. S3]QBF30056.1 acyl dehydratase [Thalassococcus sp. S3]
MDQLNVKAWEGRAEECHGGVSEILAAQLHATLSDKGGKAPAQGDPLPPLWHWSAFPPTATMAELGSDGHPPVGGFLPPVKLPRRMWAGGSLRFRAPIKVGEHLTRQSSIRSVTKKEGAGGPMVFVSVDHLIFGRAGLAIEERQDIVYLNIPDEYKSPRKLPVPDHPVLHRVMPMTETLLFRYSAVTFNAHRIHYDLPYATMVEHYPGLVVHGPLQAQLLCQAACHYRGRVPDHFDFRGVHPMFHGQTLDIMAIEADAGSLQLFTGQEGHQGMQATALWQGTV